MQLIRPILACLIFAAVWVCAPQAHAADEAAAKPEAPAANSLKFEDDIVPILEARCFKCHGAETRKGGLDLRRRFKIAEGGDSGPALVPETPDESLLIEMIEKKGMPPKGEDPLDARQIELLRRWVAAGAPTSGKSEAPLEIESAERVLTEADRQFWAYRRPERPALPAVRSSDRVRTPIDAFVIEQLESRGLSFNPDASKLVLLRRLCFDLLGLPPSPAQIDQFLADDAPGAYERLVDRLLDSPRYGERWARHWLDVVGYAESDGYLDADRERPEAWRYRDYVVRAFNSDKPYDQFIREQIAGDELRDWRASREITEELTEPLVATGFLRTASDPTYPTYKEKPEIYQVLADTVQIIGSTFLGVTIQCARCHEHKSEPISQRDYYQIQGVLAAAYDPARWLSSGERSIPLATDEQLKRTNEHNKAIDERINALNAELVRLVAEHQDKLLNEKLPGTADDLKTKIKAALLIAADKRNDEQKKLIEKHTRGVDIGEPALFARFPELKIEAEKLRGAIAAEKALTRSIVQLRGILDLDGRPGEAFVLRRGDFNNKGRIVEPGVPAVFAATDFKFQPVPQPRSTGRRRAFAEWLADPAHPLTSRLQVNRLWAWHFGKGIVETLDDFGHTGKTPSHPALLDWLATEFIARGFRQKEIQRLIVTSTVYRQSSAYDTAKAAVDGENVWLWGFRPRRHEGEVLRDALLDAAGKLNLQMFGPASPVVRQPDGSVTTNDDPAGNRRSLYLQVRRSQPVTLMESFDTPKMEINCTRRSEAIVATQALALLNSPFLEHCAKALAARIVRAAPERDQRIDFAWKLLFTREPSPTERQSLCEFLDSFASVRLADKSVSATAAERQASEDEGWIQAALSLLNTNEFLFVD